MSYEHFLSTKLATAVPTGLTSIPPIHPSLFRFQRDLVTWALKRGRAAIFCDTGLGKTRQQLEWAKHVTAYTGKPTLILAPLAVGAQTCAEALSIDVACKQAKFQGDVTDVGLYVTNYDRLHQFEPSTFGAVVLDESSIIKNHDSKTLDRLMTAFRDTPFRLCATATPSPNDYTELGTHAEFLGVCSREEMLAEYFTHDGGDTSKWRLKGHARGRFWRWVSTWAALLRSPADLGYDASMYELPPLTVERHTVPADQAATLAQGLLFAEPAHGLMDRRRARRDSLSKRAELCAAKINAVDGSWIVWCELNDEADALRHSIAGSVEIRGNDETMVKDARLGDFAAGRTRVLITKPKIAGFGLNWQHCHHVAFVGVSDSYEATYQAIRRCWRFGQKSPVDVHFFASELEGDVVANYERKQREAIAMAEELSLETRDAVRAEVFGLVRDTNAYQHEPTLMPAWLTARAPEAEP